MCRRTTFDPLLRVLLDQYGVHPLLIPREHVSIGDVCVWNGRVTAATTSVGALLQPAPALTPVLVGERMADISSIRSGSFDFNAGMRFLSSFLQHVPALASHAADVRASYEGASTAALDFRLTDLSRDSIDWGTFMMSLAPCQLRTAATFWTDRDRLYVVTAVWRARSVSVRARTKAGQAAQVRAGAMGVASGGASVAADHSDGDAILYEGDRPLAVAVEVMELVRDPRGRGVQVKANVHSLGPVRGGDGSSDELRAFIGGDADDGGEVFLSLPDP